MQVLCGVTWAPINYTNRKSEHIGETLLHRYNAGLC
jgi:hypothetical protein